MTIDTSYKGASQFGRPVFEQMDTFVQSDLIAGVEPGRQQPMRLLLASSTTLAKFQVVGLDANKKLVAATYNAVAANAITPIGVLEHGTASAANNTTIYGEVVLTGCYNVGDDDAGTGSPLVWDASFTTAAQKIASVIGNALLVFRRRKVA